MPSFDVVSEIDWVEIQNAVDQSVREIGTRFDFKGSDTRIELDVKNKLITLMADDSFKRSQVYDIVLSKMGKRGVDIRSLKSQDEEKIAGNRVKQSIKIQEGIEQALAKNIVKIIKDSRIKLQASIQGNTVRVSGAKKDVLQDAISLLKNNVKELPLQFNNFRD